MYKYIDSFTRPAPTKRAIINNILVIKTSEKLENRWLHSALAMFHISDQNSCYWIGLSEINAISACKDS